MILFFLFSFWREIFSQQAHYWQRSRVITKARHRVTKSPQVEVRREEKRTQTPGPKAQGDGRNFCHSEKSLKYGDVYREYSICEMYLLSLLICKIPCTRSKYTIMPCLFLSRSQGYQKSNVKFFFLIAVRRDERQDGYPNWTVEPIGQSICTENKTESQGGPLALMTNTGARDAHLLLLRPGLSPPRSEPLSDSEMNPWCTSRTLISFLRALLRFLPSLSTREGEALDPQGPSSLRSRPTPLRASTGLAGPWLRLAPTPRSSPSPWPAGMLGKAGLAGSGAVLTFSPTCCRYVLGQRLTQPGAPEANGWKSHQLATFYAGKRGSTAPGG